MPRPKIYNAMELERPVQQMGFLPFFSCSCAIPDFSIEAFTPSRYWFAEGVDGPLGVADGAGAVGRGGLRQALRQDSRSGEPGMVSRSGRLPAQ